MLFSSSWKKIKLKFSKIYLSENVTQRALNLKIVIYFAKNKNDKILMDCAAVLMLAVQTFLHETKLRETLNFEHLSESWEQENDICPHFKDIFVIFEHLAQL